VPHFSGSFTDVPSLAREKFTPLDITAGFAFTRDIIETTARYVLLEQPFAITPEIGVTRDLALRIPAGSRWSARNSAFSLT
jgi:hypothetical protein